MQTIAVLKPKTESLIAQFVSFYQTFSKINRLEKVIFDFSQLNWIYPLLILPISAYIHETKSEYLTSQRSDINSYLNTVRFPGGVNSVAEFQKFLSYIPVTSLEKSKQVENREKLESCFSTMLYKTINGVAGSQDAIYYPITELVGNIFEHSKKDRGWVFTQIYPNKKFLDLCIVDTGRGLRNCYKEERNIILNDKEAVKEAVGGRSTKLDKDRGFGIYSSKRVICEGLGGSFIILSGNAALISEKNREKLMEMPSFNWQGVIISYRIPFPKQAIDIYPFLE
jgi:hypothetical protein